MVVALATPVTATGPVCTYYVRAGFVPAAGIPADGSSPQRAFATITAGAQRLRNPGDVVCVGPGEYVEGDITPSRSGIEEFPVTFLADPSGELTGDLPGPVRLTPPQGLPTHETPLTAFRILGQRHVVIEGFEIEDYFDAGIQVRSAVGSVGNATAITLRNNVIRRTEKTGIDVSAEGWITVEGNVVLGSGVQPVGGSGISIRSCVDASPAGENTGNLRCRGGPSGPVEPIVANNRTGISVSHGIFVQDAENGVIQNNVIFSNDATGITLRSAPGFLVVNNLVYRNREQGIAVGSADLASPSAVIANNTFYDNGTWGIEVGSGNVASPGAMVVNNVLQRNDAGARGIGVHNEAHLDLRSTCGYVAGFNVTADDYGPKTPRNVYDINAAPLFAGPVSGPDGILGGHWVGNRLVDASQDDNFRLSQPGSAQVSPAVDAGYASVEDVGLNGSTAPDGSPDTGILDAGFHYGVEPGTIPSPPVPFMPIYVRVGGSPTAGGKSRDDALATIAAAAKRARAGVTVIVGPGTYHECQLRPTPDQGRATFLADPAGEHTGDLSRPVLVDVGCCGTDDQGKCVPGFDGFNIPNSCFVIVDGFHVTGARDDGIVIQVGSNGAEVRNNVVFTNQRRGIQVVNADDVHIFNNLAYDNGGAGISIGGACRGDLCGDAVGSKRATIESNTCYGNGFNGILVGSGPGRSTHATVRYNIAHVGEGENGRRGENGIQVGSNTTYQNHLEGYSAGYNIVFEGRYGAGTPRPPSDRIDDPLFFNPSGWDGVLGGAGFRDDTFHLRQIAAGQSENSPAVDFSNVTAVEAGLDARTTRVDFVTDQGRLDLGFHYAMFWPSTVADCDGDGNVSLDEVLRALTIALGRASLHVCPNADANGDGVVSIEELTLAVTRLMTGL